MTVLNSCFVVRCNKRVVRVFATLVAVSCLGTTIPVCAQVHPCGTGQPEHVVGTTQEGLGVASIPLCDYDEVAQPPPKPRSSTPSGAIDYEPEPPHIVIVAHPDVPELWETHGHSDQALGVKLAMDACTKAMGEGCYILPDSEWRGPTFLVVVSDSVGDKYVGNPERGSNAERNAMKQCEAVSVGCKVIATFRNSQFAGSKFPVSISPRRLAGAVAGPKDAPAEKWKYTVWLVTGRPGFKAAEGAALARCKAETGAECALRVSIGGAAIARVVQDNYHIQWMGVLPTGIEEQVKRFCEKGRQCRLIDTADTRVPADVRVDLNFSGHPARGFFALARPVDDAVEKTWRRRALATGRESQDVAKAAAVALCESESKVRCKATPPEGDEGINQFVLLSRDNVEKSRIFFGISEDDARKTQGESCDKLGVKCSRGVLVDLARPVTTTLAF